MPLLEQEDNTVYSDPNDKVNTIGDMFEFCDFVDGTQGTVLRTDETPNLDVIETTIEMEDDILLKAQEMASKDPEAIARALETIVKNMEEEYTLTTNELDIAKENLTNFHREVENALQKGEPIPDNYMKTTEELMNNIRTQQEKLNSLTPKLEQERLKCLEYAEKTQKSNKTKKVPAKILGLIFVFAKKMIEVFTRGLADLGNMLHTKNQEFARGSRQTMRDIGDKAQAIYNKTQVRQQKLTLSFKQLYEKMVNKIKEISQDIKLTRALHKEEKAEKKAVKRIDNLTEKLAKATAKAKGLESAEEKKSLLKNAFYNYALDQARIRQGELIQAMKERYDAIPHYTYKIEDAMIATQKYGWVTKDNLKIVQEMPSQEKNKLRDEFFSSMSKEDITKVQINSINMLGNIAVQDSIYVKIESERGQQNFPLYTRPKELPKDIPTSRSQELNQFDQMFKFIESPLMQEAFLSDLEGVKEQPEQVMGYSNKPVSNLEETLNKAKATVAALNNMSHKNVDVPTMENPMDR